MDESDEPGEWIGMDEAGYGPNLGPLVIVATRWQTPHTPSNCDFNTLLKNIVDSSSTCRGNKLHIADSKIVNKGKHGFQTLETSALALLGTLNITPKSVTELVNNLLERSKRDCSLFAEIPWFAEEINLPYAANAVVVNEFSREFSNQLKVSGLACLDIQAQIIPAALFNQLLTCQASKGVVLSSLAFELLGSIWEQNNLSTLVVGDKHGGRNRYDDYLAQIAGNQSIVALEESRQLSRYRIGRTEFRFQTKGEQHFPVAAASVIAKYIREVTMLQFNQFWLKSCPEVKPTKGYPMDAKRFRSDIQQAQRALAITDETLWRNR